jgi:signal transduction histidine kinase/CheY-like chemotaxis protein
VSNPPKNGDLPDDDLNLMAEDDFPTADEDQDDLLLLAEEDDDDEAVTVELSKKMAVNVNDNRQIPIINPSAPTWIVMIVDDEQEIHDVTKIALDGFVFQGKPISFISAYSGEQAKALLKEHPDTAIIFLDVVMEENDAGLQVVKYIRDTLQNNLVRIILRTGQPGEAPEEKTIINYDINDYKHKAELTRRKLFVTTIAGLRAYYDLILIEINKAALKQTLEAIPVGICVLEAHTVTPTYINQKAHQIFGSRLEQNISAENLVEVCQFQVAGTSQTYPYEKLPMVCALHGKTIHVDDLEIHQDAQNIPIESWGTPIYDNDGKVIYSLTTFQDISERQQAEAAKIKLIQEREAKNVALRYSQEIEAKNVDLVKLNRDKNEFLGIVAHDLKNPLSAIKGYAEEIEEYCHEMSKEEIVELSALIRKASAKMSTLITDLLDVNQIESGKIKLDFANVDILPIVESVAQDYAKRAKEKEINLLFSHEGNDFHAYVDANTVGQILDNIISNAVKYSPLGKKVDIKLSANEDKIRCEVKDEGEGLSEDDQKKLFGKFNRLSTKPTGGEHSTGLGLFIVKKLVEAMNAEIRCESELGKGATFIVEFK